MAEFASSSEYSPTFHYETAVQPEVYSMPHTLPGEDVSGTEAPPGVEELPDAWTSKSEVSLGSDESSMLEETPESDAFLGPQEPCSLEYPGPEGEAGGRCSPDEYLSGEAMEPLLQEGCVPEEEEEPQPIALELLPALHDPFAEVEAKLARLSSTVAAAAEVPLADVPRVPAQVADVAQAAMKKLSGQSSAGGTQVTGHVQMSSLRCPGSTPQWLWLGWPARGRRGSGGQEGRSSVSCREGGKGGFARWAPVLLMEGYLFGGFAELPWLR